MFFVAKIKRGRPAQKNENLEFQAFLRDLYKFGALYFRQQTYVICSKKKASKTTAVQVQ